MAVIVCAAAVAVAAVLLVGWPRPGLLAAVGVARSWRLPVMLAAALVVVIIVVASGALARWTAFIVAGGELAGTAGWLLARGAGERRGLASQRQVMRACSMIAGQLEAGELPAQALLITADDVPLLMPAAGAVHVGGDVPAELQRLSGQAGCDGLAWLARGWALSESTGMPLSPVTRHVADSLRRQGDIRDQRRAELSTAKSTSKLLAGLPLVGIGMGFFVGANPLAFLAGSMPGHLCLVGASTLICAGLIWTTYLAKESP